MRRRELGKAAGRLKPHVTLLDPHPLNRCQAADNLVPRAARPSTAPGTDLADQWAKDRRAELDAGRLRALVAALRIHVETTPEARKCIHYVFGNRHRMRYPQFRAKGLCISSGVVEAGCKQIGARLKRAGMRWTVAGANAIIALRCCILSGRFEDFWERRAANAA